MSSLVRRIQRRRKRVLADYARPAQVYKENEDGMEVLHPTKGWRRVSKKRLGKKGN